MFGVCHDAFIYFALEDDTVSVSGTLAAEGSLGQLLPRLRVLRSAGDGERRRAEADDRNSQTATSGKAAPERETKHHSHGPSGGASHGAAQTAFGARQTGWYP